MNKRLPILTLTVMLVLSLLIFTACDTEATNNTTESPTTKTESTVKAETTTETGGETEDTSYFPLDEQITVTVLQMSFSRGRDTIVDQAIEEATNIQFDWDLVESSDISEKVDVALAAAALPDLFVLNNATTRIAQYGGQGLFADLSAYLDQMVNYNEWREEIPQIYTSIVTADGALYGLPEFNTGVYVNQGWGYRKDIWEEQGLEYPMTLSELEEQLLQLKEAYPDIYPITVRYGEEGVLCPFFKVFRTWGGYIGNISLDENDDTYKLGASMDEWRDTLSYVNRLYEEELIDPEFATLSNDQFIEKVYNGEVFVFYNYFQNFDAYATQAQKTIPDFEIEAEAPPVTDDGVQGWTDWSLGVNSYWVASINSQSEYIETLAMYLDWQISEEGMTLINWGIEGETYTVDGNGVKTLMDNIATVSNPDGDLTLAELGIDNRSGFWAPWDVTAKIEKNLGENGKAGMDMYLDNPEYLTPIIKTTISFTDEESETNASIMDAVTTYIAEKSISFITGDLDIDDDAVWEDFQQDLKDLGYEEVVNLYNEKYNALSEDEKGFIYADDYVN